MRPVDVCVRHQNDAAISHSVEVKRSTRTGTNDLDDRGALRILQHIAERSFLDVQNLSPDRKDGLHFGVTRLLCGAKCAIALNDKELGT